MISSTDGTAWAAVASRPASRCGRSKVYAVFDEASYTVAFVSFQVTCTSPASDCSSRRPPVVVHPETPGRAGHQRRAGGADERAGGEELVREGDPRRDARRCLRCERVVDGLRQRLRRRRRAAAAARGDGDGRAADSDDERRPRARSGGASRACGASSRRSFLEVLARTLPTFSEGFLTAGSSIVKRAPSAVARPPCRSAVARTIASPRPEPGRSDRARQNRSKARAASSGARPGPSSSTLSRRDARRSRLRHGCVRRRGPCRRAFSTRFESARSSAAGSARTVAGSAATSTSGAANERASSSRPDLLLGRQRRLLPREREQVVGKAREPVGVGLEVVDQLRRRAVTREVRDVPAQRGQRRAQLVRRVGEEAALGVARALEAGEHRVQRRREPADLVVRCGLGQPPPCVAGPLDLARRAGEPRERLQRAAHQERDGERADRGGGEPGEHGQRVQRADRLGDVGRRRADDHRPAARRARRRRRAARRTTAARRRRT